MVKVIILPQFHNNGIADKISDQKIVDESQFDSEDLDLFITLSKSQYLIAKFLEENSELPVIDENNNHPIPEAMFLQGIKENNYLFPTGKLPSDYDMLTFKQKTWLLMRGAYLFRLLSGNQLHGFYDHPDNLADSVEAKKYLANTHSNYLMNFRIILSREYRLLAHANNIANVSGSNTVAAIFDIGHKFNDAIKCFSDITIEFVDSVYRLYLKVIAQNASLGEQSKPLLQQQYKHLRIQHSLAHHLGCLKIGRLLIFECIL
jgi:hypothetical protein